MSEKVESENNSIFVYGCIRSGTTLLRSILNSHPRICCPRETAFFLLANQKNHLYNDATLFWEKYKNHKRFVYQSISPEIVENQLGKSSFNYKELFDALMLSFLADSKKNIWCEKTPGHEHFIRSINSSFPNAKSIFVIRDPRAVVLSISMTPWGSKNLDVQCKIWKKSVKQFFGNKKKLALIEVRYENLVKNTEEVVVYICRSLGIDYHPQMLTNRNINGANIDDPSSNWRKEYESAVSRDVDSNSLETWKRELTFRDIRKIEILCNSEMKLLNYSRITNENKLTFILLKVIYKLQFIGYKLTKKLSI